MSEYQRPKPRFCYTTGHNPPPGTHTLKIPEPINQLIHHIYQGVMEDEPWSDFLSQLNQVFDSDLAVLVVVPNRQPGNRYLLNRVVNKQAELPSSTANHWIALDPFEEISPDQATLLDELDNPSKIEDTDFYRELIQPSGIRYILAINIMPTEQSDLMLKLRIARQGDKHNFVHRDVDILNSLTDHFKLALKFLDQMAIKQIERNAFADAINQFMLGTLILDRQGKMVASNRVARDTIEQNEALSNEGGVLTIHDKKANQQLYESLSAISKDSSGLQTIPKTIMVNPASRKALGLMVRPVRPEDTLTHPVHAHAVVFISDPKGTPEISAATLKELFGFTGSESRVAAYLANGHTLNETAEALSISINTAKSHARNIYEKTGVNKQTKFIQLISNSVARVS